MNLIALTTDWLVHAHFPLYMHENSCIHLISKSNFKGMTWASTNKLQFPIISSCTTYKWYLWCCPSDYRRPSWVIKKQSLIIIVFVLLLEFYFSYWSVFGKQYCISARCTTWWSDTSIHDEVITIDRAATCHHAKLLQYHWLCSLCCTFYFCDLFIPQLEICISHSPLPFLPIPPFPFPLALL